jgi:hypothetical protein
MQNPTPTAGLVTVICACCGKPFQIPDDGHIGFDRHAMFFCGDCQARLKGPSDAAKDTWNPLLNPSSDLLPATAKDAVSRFLQTKEGCALIHDLSGLLPPGKPRIDISFVQDLPEGSDSSGAGEFSPQQIFPATDEATDPEARANFKYHVWIKYQGDGPPSIIPRHFPPSGTSTNGGFDYDFREGSSEMAATVEHELSHVWFMNKNQTTNTGHDQGRDASQYDSGFLDRSKKFCDEMNKLENCLKKWREYLSRHN